MNKTNNTTLDSAQLLFRSMVVAVLLVFVVDVFVMPYVQGEVSSVMIELTDDADTDAEEDAEKEKESESKVFANADFNAVDIKNGAGLDFYSAINRTLHHFWDIPTPPPEFV